MANEWMVRPTTIGERTRYEVYKILHDTGDVITRINATKDEQKAAFASMCFKFRKGLDFAKPCYREDLKSMSRYFNPPLNYQSVE